MVIATYIHIIITLIICIFITNEYLLSEKVTEISPIRDSCFQSWEFSHRFSEQITLFFRQNERLSDLLILGERPEQFAHGRSFLVSDLSDLLTLLTKKKGMSELLIF